MSCSARPVRPLAARRPPAALRRPLCPPCPRPAMTFSSGTSFTIKGVGLNAGQERARIEVSDAASVPASDTCDAPLSPSLSPSSCPKCRASRSALAASALCRSGRATIALLVEAVPAGSSVMKRTRQASQELAPSRQLVDPLADIPPTWPTPRCRPARGPGRARHRRGGGCEPRGGRAARPGGRHALHLCGHAGLPGLCQASRWAPRQGVAWGMGDASGHQPLRRALVHPLHSPAPLQRASCCGARRSTPRRRGRCAWCTASRAGSLRWGAQSSE